MPLTHCSTSNWNVSRVVDASSIFSFATAFNKDLCAWGSRLTNTTLMTDMFVGTSCPYALNAPWFTYSPPGPFCHDCCCRPTLPSAIEGPFEVPLVPALASNMFGNLIVAWSGNARYRFGYGSGGTYTTLFDPISHASTLRSVEGKRSMNLMTCSLDPTTYALYSCSMSRLWNDRNGTMRAVGPLHSNWNRALISSTSRSCRVTTCSVLGLQRSQVREEAMEDKSKSIQYEFAQSCLVLSFLFYPPFTPPRFGSRWSNSCDWRILECFDDHF
jgi:Mycoplasma protein of unknown function, DUF285